MHCITVLLCKQEDVRSNTEYSVNLGAGIAAIKSKTHEAFEKMSKGRIIALVSTDYFGGSGNQESEVWQDGNLVLKLDDSFYTSLKPINSALSLLGVVSEEGKDQFDTVGLGKFRTDSDFPFNKKVEIDVEEYRYVMSKIKNDGIDYCFRHYSNFEEIVDEEFHILRKAYLKSSDNLIEYIQKKIEKNEN